MVKQHMRLPLPSTTRFENVDKSSTSKKGINSQFTIKSVIDNVLLYESNKQSIIFIINLLYFVPYHARSTK